MRIALLTFISALSLPAWAAPDAPAWQAQAIHRAVEHHTAHRPDYCIPLDRATFAPTSFELQLGEETAARQALLVEFPCRSGAYNYTSVYLMSDQHGTVTEVLFPSPQVEVRYASDSNPTDVLDITITATPELREVVNPEYESSSRSMTERNKWRGVGDAYTLTRWGYKHGRFQIMRFAVDASFDGADTPRTLIERELW